MSRYKLYGELRCTRELLQDIALCVLDYKQHIESRSNGKLVHLLHDGLLVPAIPLVLVLAFFLLGV